MKSKLHYNDIYGFFLFLVLQTILITMKFPINKALSLYLNTSLFKKKNIN